MMQCQICGDTQGPFEIAEITDYGDSRTPKTTSHKIVCETCAYVYQPEGRKKKHATTHIRNKRHGGGVSRTNSWSE